MMIDGRFVDVVPREQQRIRIEPAIARVIDIFNAALRLDLMRDAPRRCAAAAVFLGDGKGNALVKSCGPQRHLSGVRATAGCRVGHIERKVCADLLLDGIEHATETQAHAVYSPELLPLGKPCAALQVPAVVEGDVDPEHRLG